MTSYVKSVLQMILTDRQNEARRIAELIIETEKRLADLRSEAQALRQNCDEIKNAIAE